jgi:hypothetical protein
MKNCSSRIHQAFLKPFDLNYDEGIPPKTRDVRNDY